ncbi:MAG: RNA polymerase sigma factor [Myxococcales bacterium]|nr:RNA polymerase sigma factor [Myxococcales bacterium]
MDDEDAALMCRTRDGDAAAFAELFARWRVPMVRFAVRYTGDQARGEELAQDVFLKIYRARARYEPREPFRAYIFKVATNHCLNAVTRAEHRHGRVALDDLAIPPPAPRTDPVELLDAESLQRRVRAAVATLPERQRAALLLQKEDGLGYQEIADALATSVSAVKSMLNRARGVLLAALEPDRPAAAAGGGE